MKVQLVDRVLGTLGLVCTSPALALAAIGIRASSPGPLLYRAQRAGIGGRPFTMLKLRTMHVGADEGGRITSSADSRVFPVGRALRRMKLDEVPQLVNVVRGQMSLVGPRPEDVSIVRDHYDAMMWESLEVPPGLTSPGSLHFFAAEAALPLNPADAERHYVDTLLRHKIALDLVYVRNRSIAYQVEILIRTLLGVAGLGRLFARRMEWERVEASRILQEAGR